ncbi:MAG: holo-ACP synthase [Fidelibacterota bacterium]
MIHRYSVGTDIVEVHRLRAMSETHGNRFYRRLFTEEEVNWCRTRRNPYVHLAGKFAAKEAVKKALAALGETGTVPFSSVEVVRRDHSSPEVKIRCNLKGTYRFQVSISHTSHLATAVVLAERT